MENGKSWKVYKVYNRPISNAEAYMKRAGLLVVEGVGAATLFTLKSKKRVLENCGRHGGRLTFHHTPSVRL